MTGKVFLVALETSSSIYLRIISLNHPHLQLITPLWPPIPLQPHRLHNHPHPIAIHAPQRPTSIQPHTTQNHTHSKTTVQITFIFIGQTRLVFGKCVCTCVTKHSNAFRTFLNWLKNSKRVWHEPKLHISRLPAGCVLRFKRKRKITNAKIYEDKRDLYCTHTPKPPTPIQLPTPINHTP